MSAKLNLGENVASSQVEDDDEDDWEKAYSREDEPEATESSRNAKLWQEANSGAYKSSIPTYTILPSSSASSSASRIPPQAAIIPSAPTLTILKRPSSASSSTPSSRTATPREMTLKEREKQYEEAKRRIFGDSPASSTTTSASSLDIGKLSLKDSGRRRSNKGTIRSGGSTSDASNGLLAVSAAAGANGNVVRAPKGPAEGKGFGFRAVSTEKESKGREAR